MYVVVWVGVAIFGLHLICILYTTTFAVFFGLHFGTSMALHHARTLRDLCAYPSQTLSKPKGDASKAQMAKRCCCSWHIVFDGTHGCDCARARGCVCVCVRVRQKQLLCGRSGSCPWQGKILLCTSLHYAYWHAFMFWFSSCLFQNRIWDKYSHMHRIAYMHVLYSTILYICSMLFTQMILKWIN